MSEKDGGGSAFPTLGSNVREGMKLRDYFAAQVLTGIAKEPGEGCKGYIAQRVRVAYAIADEMLTQRAT